MEDDLNYFLKKEDDLYFLKMDDDLKKIMQPKTIKSKNNDCGTAPGNLVHKQSPTFIVGDTQNSEECYFIYQDGGFFLIKTWFDNINKCTLL